MNLVRHFRCALLLAAFLLALPWMMQKAMAYTTALLGELERYAR